MGKFLEIIVNSRASIEKADLAVLLPLVAEIEPKNILEIGAWKGYSAEVWIKAFNPISLVTLEKDKREIQAYHNPAYNFWYEADSHNKALQRDVENYLPTVDFLFIDGDHSLEGVKQDFEMYSPFVRKGGIIAFHDALYHHDGTEEVDIFWNEIKTKYPYVEIKVGERSTGIGVIYV